MSVQRALVSPFLFISYAISRGAIGDAPRSTRAPSSRRYEHPVHAATVRGDAVTTINPTVKPEVKLGVVNIRYVGNQLDYVFDHIIDNNLDIVAIDRNMVIK